MFEQLEKLQAAQPWTDLWSGDFLNDPRSYKEWQHCIINIAAKTGSILQRIEMADHYGEEYSLALNTHKDVTDLAIIIMSALKAANVHPQGMLDIARYVKADMERRS